MWLPRLGSNQGFQLQRLACYHYTTGHCELLLSIVLAYKAAVKGRSSRGQSHIIIPSPSGEGKGGGVSPLWAKC